MNMSHRKSRQSGAALIIGLILLAIITLLAVVGMNIANSELASATSEQLRLRSFQAAEAGLEHGLVDIKDVGTDSVASAGIKKTAKPISGSVKDIDGNPIDTYVNTYTFRGTSTAEGYGGKDFAAFHFSIASDGTSSRNAVAHHEQGAYLVGSTGGVQDFGALP
jgi:Tfp pilus assembly protein PilX